MAYNEWGYKSQSSPLYIDPVRAFGFLFGEKMPGLGRYLLLPTKHRLTISLAAPSCCYEPPSSKERMKTCAREDGVGHGQKGSSESPA